VLGIFLATAVATADSAHRAVQGAADVTGRVINISRIYALVREYFAHWEGVPRTDFEEAYRDYVEHAVRAETRKAFSLATLRFLAALRNGHTQFFDNQLDGRPLKFRLLEVEGQWVVIASQDSRLSRGDVVRSIDGRPVDDVVAEAAQYVSASNDRLARTHVFSYPALFPERVSLTLQDGVTVLIDRAVPSDVPEAPSFESRAAAGCATVRSPIFECRRLATRPTN
jgi:carboxyl-terminal processing protease